jgi:hypothetical protein
MQKKGKRDRGQWGEGKIRKAVRKLQADEMSFNVTEF